MNSETSFQIESLHALFEYATEGIIISDKQGRIVSANPSAERIFGYLPTELLQHSISDLIPGRLKERHEHSRREYNAQPHARAMGKYLDLFALRKDGSEFPVEVSLSYYKKEEETFVIAFVIDITERKKHEASILKLNQELEKKVEERTKVLQEALIELESSKEQLSQALTSERELNDMKSRFVTMASHEFRTPLSTILSSISLVNKYNEGDNAGKVDKHVQKIKSAVTNMTFILNDFLSAERLETGSVLVRIEEGDLTELVQSILSELNGFLKPGQTMEYQHNGRALALFDKQILRNILLNLLSNAIKFSNTGPIRVQSFIDNGTLSLTVSDQGIGIPAEEQEYVFQRFFRSQNATNIQGTGLGLNIVSKYLESLGGRIRFESELHKGTCFFVDIPIHQS